MSPDIEWRVGEEAEQETIARITTQRPSRWRKPIVLVMAALGIGLGALYASILEPPRTIAPRPIAPPPPIATPLPSASSLAQTIDREVRALANGDRQAFSDLLDPDDDRWKQDQISSFTPWGAPRRDDQLYHIIAVADGPDGQHAWADVVQYRNRKFFRETRFYRLRDGAWLRTAPIAASISWGAEKTIATRYFQLTYSAADEEPARLLAGYLARQSRETCRIFGCNFDERPPVVHFILRPDELDRQQDGPLGGSTVTVTLPSPRLAGYYTTDFSGVDIDDDKWDQYFVGPLYFLLLSTAIGGPERWDRQRDGLMYMFAVGLWDLSRRKQSLVGLPEFPFRSELMTGTVSLTADEMWHWPQDTTEADDDLRLARASALVQFIDETYGANTVRRFFGTLRFAQSLPHAISRLGVPYEEFEAKWLEWSSRLATRKSDASN